MFGMPNYANCINQTRYKWLNILKNNSLSGGTLK